VNHPCFLLASRQSARRHPLLEQLATSVARRDMAGQASQWPVRRSDALYAGVSSDLATRNPRVLSPEKMRALVENAYAAPSTAAAGIHRSGRNWG
jgi:hypothetical protein